MNISENEFVVLTVICCSADVSKFTRKNMPLSGHVLPFSSPDGNYTKMGFYDFVSDNLTWFNLEKWPGIGQFVCYTS